MYSLRQACVSAAGIVRMIVRHAGTKFTAVVWLSMIIVGHRSTGKVRVLARTRVQVIFSKF
eukprot:SAG31_NODE_9555_length_1259_cov_1.734483_1_plen_61_part_00